MGEIFVSYSRKDSAYVGRLVTYLRGAGLDVWIDEEIARGERWDRALRAKIDGCAAVVLVMSPDAEESAWVGEEVDRARARGKPILPLLLDGEVFFGFSRTQHEDVTGGRMPGSSFLDRLRGLCGAAQPETAPPVAGPRTTHRADGGVALLSTIDGHGDAVTAVAYSPRGSELATGSRDRTIRTWPASGYGQVRVLERHTDTVSSLAFTPDGRHLASAGADGLCVLWRRSDGSPEAELAGHTKAVNSVTCNPRSGTIATGSEDATIRIWDPSGLAGQILTDTDGRVRAVAFSPDGRYLAAGGRAGVHLRDGHTAARGEPLPVTDPFSTTSLAWSPDSRLLAVAGDDGIVRMYDVETAVMVRSVRCHSGRVYSVAWSPDGRRLATGGLTGVARIWRASTGDLVDTLSGHSGRVFGVAYSADGRQLATASGDRTTRLWGVA